MNRTVTPTRTANLAASDTARQAIRVLAQRRLPPTPDNYAAAYREIAGSDDGCEALGALRVLEHVGATLPLGTAAPLLRAMEAGRWDDVERLVAAAFARSAEDAAPGLAETLRTLLRQWDAQHADVPRTRKMESIEHILATCGGDPPVLIARLARLVNGWGAGIPGDAVEDDSALVDALGMLAGFLRFAFVGRVELPPELSDEAAGVAARAERARTRADVREVGKALDTFHLHYELDLERNGNLASALHAVLGLVVQNLESLVEDEAAVSGQLAQLRTLLAAPPTPHAIRQVESSLRGLVYRQYLAKHSLGQAKESLKSMLQNFLVRLGDMATATGTYQDRLAGHAAQILRARDISELCKVVDALGDDARSMQSDLARTRDELVAERDRAEAYAAKVQRLEAELVAASAAAREDALTQVLNRRGLEEAMTVEAARADRSGAPVAVAILDLDNFKALNDRLGHAVGDAALAHLSAVARGSLRPTDVIARYGGEEFVVLLPATPLADAAEVMTRLQRELTRRFFMHNNERVLVTFSCGITMRAAGEDNGTALERADTAMLRAKREGKNRVVTV